MTNDPTSVVGTINQALREAASKHAQERRKKVSSDIKQMMALIDDEMEQHNGIYPHNGGSLNQRELCRRAGIHWQTLQQPAHKKTTLADVKTWLSSKTVKTTEAAKKVVTEKADYWKEQHAIVTTNIVLLELELNEREVKFREMLEEFDKAKRHLEVENERLRIENSALRHKAAEVHSAPKVTPFKRQGN